MKVVVVVPAYNESRNILRTLQDLKEHAPYPVVVVDDGSRDGTGALAAPFATVLSHPVNRGMGASLATGTAYALLEGADIVVHFDADGQHRASDIEQLVRPLVEGRADVVLGSRYLAPNRIPWTKKYLIHKPALMVQNSFLRLPLTDIHSGMRAMNRSAAREIRITQDRMAHASEIIAEIARHRLRFEEVPVTVVYREYGQNFIDGLKIYRDLIVRKLFK